MIENMICMKQLSLLDVILVTWTDERWAGDDGLNAIASNQRINTTLCKIKTSIYLES